MLSSNVKPSMKLTHVALIVVVAALLAGCAAGRAFKRGDQAARAGDWDTAVAHYRQAIQHNPHRPEYRIALERAMSSASQAYLARARELEEKGDLPGAVAAYRKAAEHDPVNRQAAAKAADLDRLLREQLEAARPRPRIEQLREEARRESAPPLLNPASRDPLRLQFTNASLRDILNFIGVATGINVTYDPQFQDRPYTASLQDVTIEDALNQILLANQMFYKVLNGRTIIVVPDNPPKRAQYEEQVIRVFFISHASAQELTDIINGVLRVPQMAVQPMVHPNEAANTITVRATTAVAAIIERLIAANDKPRAEILVDVEILEVNRSRAKQFGLNLSQYALGGVFSPEVAPPNESTPPVLGGSDGAGLTSPLPFNLNTISQGVSTADFYTAVPAAVVRFLESDSQTRLIAKPQLRGAEGQTMTLNLGDEIPVPTTVFGAAAPGGISSIPISSFNYRPVGVIVEMTPRVTYEGEIVLELEVESSTLGSPINVAGQSLPTFGSRKVITQLRLRDGESNLLAGLLREEERKALRGFPGTLRLPVLSQLLSDNDTSINQTDIIMLLTPRILRSHELTREDVSPIHIGTQQNIGLTGPPPLIAPQPEGEPEEAAAAPPPVPGAAPADAVETPPPAEVLPLPPPAQILVTPPGSEFVAGEGPYTVPLTVSGASQISVLTLTLRFDLAVLGVRSVQEGSFMRQGGIATTFTQQVDPGSGRIDLTVMRTNDATGASGSGLAAAVVLDAVAPGVSALVATGAATSPQGTALPVQFSPASVTVR